MSDLGKRLIKAADEAVAISRGEAEAPRVFVPMTEIDHQPEVVERSLKKE